RWLCVCGAGRPRSPGCTCRCRPWPDRRRTEDWLAAPGQPRSAASTLAPMTCTACGAANRAGRRFCGQCGAALERACPSCGSPNDDGERFCGACGGLLEAAFAGPAGVDAAPSTASTAPAAAGDQPVAERRHVSVLFADLVGFTRLSDQRDAEDVRELLSRYFATARTIIGRYGGTVEKFIGDAVMAVWGASSIQENDAERAVRAALELVDAV